MTVSDNTKLSPERKVSANWKGGRTISSHGYVLIWVGKGHPLADVRGYTYEHRLKAFEAGEDITGKEVHHKNEATQHNETDNLEALTRAEHKFRHRKDGSNLRKPGEDNSLAQCACGCGGEFDRYDNHGRPRDYITGHARKGKGRENPLISCACGCGTQFRKYDSGSRSRRFVAGHNGRTN